MAVFVLSQGMWGKISLRLVNSINWSTEEWRDWQQKDGSKFQVEEPAAAAESLQSCPTLCDPTDCSLPGSSVPGSFQARVLEWGASAFSDMLMSICKPVI